MEIHLLRDKLLKLYNGEGNKCMQSPSKWFEKNNITEFDDILKNEIRYKLTKKERQENLKTFKNELKISIHKEVLGVTYCESCGSVVNRLLPGWKGFTKTCSKKCEKEFHSKRQMGKNNTCHRMTPETKKISALKNSITTKQKILNGEFTPKSNNYNIKTLIEIDCPMLGKHKLRSLWELIFWVVNPHLKYESVRVSYYDNDLNKDRIYILDFYDPNTNTLYEVKPKKWQYTLKDKMNFENTCNYNYVIIDEDYLEKYRYDSEIKSKISDIIVDEDLKNKRLKWFRV